MDWPSSDHVFINRRWWRNFIIPEEEMKRLRFYIFVKCHRELMPSLFSRWMRIHHLVNWLITTYYLRQRVWLQAYLNQLLNHRKPWHRGLRWWKTESLYRWGKHWRTKGWGGPFIFTTSSYRIGGCCLRFLMNILISMLRYRWEVSWVPTNLEFWGPSVFALLWTQSLYCERLRGFGACNFFCSFIFLDARIANDVFSVCLLQ